MCFMETIFYILAILNLALTALTLKICSSIHEVVKTPSTHIPKKGTGTNWENMKKVFSSINERSRPQ